MDGPPPNAHANRNDRRSDGGLRCQAVRPQAPFRHSQTCRRVSRWLPHHTLSSLCVGGFFFSVVIPSPVLRMLHTVTPAVAHGKMASKGIDAPQERSAAAQQHLGAPRYLYVACLLCPFFLALVIAACLSLPSCSLASCLSEPS